VVRTSNAERRFTITVAGAMEPRINAVFHTSVSEIKAKEFVFVGHANADGYDRTAVAKPGIDRLVEQAKKRGVAVVYWVSNEYPEWYTADRRPDYAFVSEGQEHEIHIDAERVTFSGGDFMFCLLRNVQMTLHDMVQHGRQRIDFVLPADAIWVEDIWDSADKRWYPAPMLTLNKLFARRRNDGERYDQVVVPFLNRTFKEYPVFGYPLNSPAPALIDLLKDWNIVVRFAERFERFYQRGTADKTLVVTFQGV